MKYALPCSCGKTIPIETSQAGETVTCSCGKQLEVPTMRAIRQLDPLRELTPARTQSARQWSTTQRLCFSIGMAVAALGFAVGAFYEWGRANLDTEEVAWDTRLETDMELLDQMNLEAAWENWKKVRSSDIGPYHPPRFIKSRVISDFWKKYVIVGFGIGLGGLVLMGIAFVLPRQHDRLPRKPARPRKPSSPH